MARHNLGLGLTLVAYLNPIIYICAAYKSILFFEVANQANQYFMETEVLFLTWSPRCLEHHLIQSSWNPNESLVSSSTGFRLNASSWPMFLLKTLNGAEMAPSRIFHQVRVKGPIHSKKNPFRIRFFQRTVGFGFGTITLTLYVQFPNIEEYTGNYTLGLITDFLFPPHCFPAGAPQSTAELL